MTDKLNRMEERIKEIEKKLNDLHREGAEKRQRIEKKFQEITKSVSPPTPAGELIPRLLPPIP